ncbi:MAG: triacylglycerol lipase [Verrucomicrobiaceae bacterium]|nr:MAG: triacylglycerol lipase [Verrucomicrobiaceae bacterium]
MSGTSTRAWIVAACLLIFGVLSPLPSEAESSEETRSAAHRPVLLIHGLKDTARKMEKMARYLRAQGRDAHTLSLSPSWGQVGLEELAQQLAAYVDRTFGPEQPFDLIGFSMGGIVSRYYVQRLGGKERVRNLVTISSPHRGTLFAYLVPNAGCRQMRPHSAFLRDLDSDAEEVFQKVRFTSFWTPLDLIILPAASSIVPNATCHRIWCAAHPLMVWEPRCLRAVAQALEG